LYPFDLSKVVLGAKFDDKTLYLSDVILDKAKYWIEPIECPVRSICSHGSHIIYITHNASIRQDTNVALQLLSYTSVIDKSGEKLIIPEPLASSYEYKCRPGLIKFKINMEQFSLDEEPFDNFKAYLKVYVNDDDVEPYVQEDFGSLNLWIKVKQHIQNNENCPCVENKENLEKFDDIPHHLKNLKRRRSCETRTRSSIIQPKKFLDGEKMPNSNTSYQNGHNLT